MGPVPFGAVVGQGSGSPLCLVLSSSARHRNQVVHGCADSAKGNWTLEELGRTLHPAREYGEWDGLVAWFLDYTAAHPEALANSSVRRWHGAAVLAVTSTQRSPRLA